MKIIKLYQCGTGILQAAFPDTLSGRKEVRRYKAANPEDCLETIKVKVDGKVSKEARKEFKIWLKSSRRRRMMRG